MAQDMLVVNECCRCCLFVDVIIKDLSGILLFQPRAKIRSGQRLCDGHEDVVRPRGEIRGEDERKTVRSACVWLRGRRTWCNAPGVFLAWRRKGATT